MRRSNTADSLLLATPRRIVHPRVRACEFINLWRRRRKDSLVGEAAHAGRAVWVAPAAFLPSYTKISFFPVLPPPPPQNLMSSRYGITALLGPDDGTAGNPGSEIERWEERTAGWLLEGVGLLRGCLF